MVIFEERQRFRQWWLWAILLFAAASGLHTAWRLHAAGEVVMPVVMVLIGVGIPVAFLWLSLRTTIDKDCIRVALPPFNARTIARKDVAAAHVRTYRPLAEYGGWGYRKGARGTAYNISGDQGLQLELKDGSRLLIGTQQPKRLQRVISAWLRP